MIPMFTPIWIIVVRDAAERSYREKGASRRVTCNHLENASMDHYCSRGGNDNSGAVLFRAESFSLGGIG